MLQCPCLTKLVLGHACYFRLCSVRLVCSLSGLVSCSRYCEIIPFDGRKMVTVNTPNSRGATVSLLDRKSVV